MSLDIKVEEAMSREVITVDFKDTVQKAAELMANKRIGSVLVMKNNNPVGIITERDIIREVVVGSRDAKKTKSKDIMKSPIVYIKPENSIGDVIEKMKKHKVRRFPVVHNGNIVGMITNTDIARLSPDMFDILELRFQMKNHKPFIRETTTSGVCEKCGNYSDDLVIKGDKWICGFCRAPL